MTNPNLIAVLAAVDRLIREHGYSPSVREIGELAGYTSSSMIYDRITALYEADCITYMPMQTRTIRVTSKGKRVLKEAEIHAN
ncbi:LexA family protein [Levilactobacillus tangyuanensis]|uniref:LexA family protein n=1 Tax=Levilactobacillus tangyuanensis TaxID=2486021 RepID=A0ABW1TP56_9LACO|nr:MULTISPECIES: hypothetical protein [Levilactobacillus]